MAKKPSKVPIIYIGQKKSEEDTVAGTGLRWTRGQAHFVTLEEAGKLLYHANVWADGRTEDDKRKFGPIAPIPPVNQQYAEQTEAEAAEGLDVMPLVDVRGMDARGLVTFAGTYLGKQLDVEDGKEKLLEQVNRAVVGAQYDWA